MSYQERITFDPAVCGGRAVIRGMRYPVELVLELLAAGVSVEEILGDHPDLEADDVFAALGYATLAVAVP
ncbi:DUF433 domain-containing protein [Nocardia sp. NPDC052001]|uniref:DUF433 domain-containing protein n=1 Tax=unclassified Nocardia TaxID=2637762 RepID=UPI003425BD79